jgi:hypothetical protein
MLNQTTLELGKVPVEAICDDQDSMLNRIPQISNLDIPKNLNHARKSALWDRWRRACMEELSSLESFAVWDVVNDNQKRKVAGLRWVFALKQNLDNSISWFKARFFFQGFTQHLGVDCFETLPQWQYYHLF